MKNWVTVTYKDNENKEQKRFLVSWDGSDLISYLKSVGTIATEIIKVKLRK